MTEISKDDVLRLASLSKIKLSGEQASILSRQMTEIEGLVAKLDELDVEGVEAAAQVSGLTNISRADEAIDYEVSQPELLKNSIEVSNNQIKVPKVL